MDFGGDRTVRIWHRSTAVKTSEVESLYIEKFGQKPACSARAPGRVELLGNHTDYNQGFVMALAVDKCITQAASPRADGVVELVSAEFRQTAKFSIDSIAKDPAVPWSDYAKGLLIELGKRGVRMGGYNAAIHSTIPLGAGLSSSAALLVSTALVVRDLYPYSLTETGVGLPPSRKPDGSLPELSIAEKMILSKICQAAENKFVGVNCGLLDYISSLYGRANKVVLIDCLNLTVDWVPFPEGLSVVVCHSGVKHALVAGEYNERRRCCEEAAHALGVHSLRFVSPSDLESGRRKLTDLQYRRAAHVVGENNRVQLGAQALRSNDLELFGRFLFESHKSSQENFENSCPELDLLVELAKSDPACIGARLTGGGFGGATLNLVKRGHAEAFRQRMASGYEKAFGRKLESWECEVVDGAA
ncbi:MAG: galactokinase [Verrucomicrobia bacterium]|nr:galactokinase [Verrucomicrobiota bacterium]